MHDSVRSSDVRLVTPTLWQQFVDFANVLKAFIGTSYLSLPFAFKESGLVVGAVTLIIIAAITDHCCQLIIKCKTMAVDLILDSSEHYKELQNEECYEEMRILREEVEQEMTLGDIGLIAIGKWGIRIVDIALVVTQTGFCVAYFIFIGNTLQDMFPVKWMGSNHTMVNGTNVTHIDMINKENIRLLRNTTPLVPPLVAEKTAPPFVLLLLIPFPFLVLMSFVRYVRKLGPISGVANVAILVGFVSLLAHILRGMHFKLDEVSLANWITFPIFFGQLTGAFEGIGCIIPIESSMGSNRPRFPLYLHLTLCQVSVILGSFGILGYLVYGSNVPQIVTNTLTNDIFSQIIRVTLIVAVLFTYPLQLIPVVRITESLVFGKKGKKKKSHLSELVAGHSLSKRDIEKFSSNSIQENSEDDEDESTPLTVPKVEQPFVYKKLTWKRNVIRTLLVTATAAIAVLLKDEFAYVNAFIGSMGSSVLAYILPCVFHLVLFKNSNSGFIVIKNIIFILFGIIGGIVGVVMTVRTIIHDMTHPHPN